MTTFPANVVTKAVVPTIKKYCYLANRMGRDASAVYNDVAGLVPPTGFTYGRYFDSGNPLLQFELFNGSIDEMIAQGVSLRQTLSDALQSLLDAAKDKTLSQLAPAVYASYDALVGCCARPLDTINICSILAGFKPPPVNSGTDALGKQIDSLAAITAMIVRVAAFVNLAKATAQYTPTSTQDAVGLRNSVCLMLDDEILRLATVFDDPDVQMLTALRNAVATDLNARGLTLRPVTTITYSANLPSLVLAQKLYQDEAPNREPDLVARNPVPCAGFMPTIIEALT